MYALSNLSRAAFAAILAFAAFATAACGDDDDAADDGGDTKEGTFARAEQVIEPGKSYAARVKTSKGEFVVELFAEEAPNTVNSFAFLAREGFFDGLTFHRVVKDFVIQGGDPTGQGSGGPGYETKDEPNEISNERGTLAMAKTPGADEFGSQFFINLGDNTGLDYNNDMPDKFYPFGRVIEGMDVVDAIADSPVDSGDRPDPPVIIETVTIEER